MSESCKDNCKTCAKTCGERREAQSMLIEPNAHSNVKKVIGVVSGKGGVGKSLVTSLLATSLAKQGKKVGILDADITGPSIPRIFGVQGKADACEAGLIPKTAPSGVKIMSTNLLLENETDPVVWRGPMISGIVRQFWSDVAWGEIDVLLVDMPPGTGDVPLTVFQSLPISGIVVVTSPQELVSMIVGKAVKMANSLNVPVLGLVENMAYFECPNCNERHYIFGESSVEALAKEYQIGATAQIPINPSIASLCDAGQVDQVESSWLCAIAEAIA